MDPRIMSVCAGALIGAGLCCAAPATAVPAKGGNSRETSTSLFWEVVTPAPDEPVQVILTYEVLRLPPRSRVVLECKHGPKGDYEVIDWAEGPSGRLVDPDPSTVRSQYRVIVQGIKGRVAAQGGFLLDL